MNKYNLTEIYKKIEYHTFNGEESTQPISCVAVNKETGVYITSSRNMIDPLTPRGTNKRLVEKYKESPPKWHRHAENYVIQRLIEMGYKATQIDLFVSFQPCNGCSRMLKRNGYSETYIVVDKGYICEEEDKGTIVNHIIGQFNSKQRRIYERIYPIIEKQIDRNNAILEQERIVNRKNDDKKT